MTLCAGVGCHTAFTASHISTAKSSSVAVKLSGEYSKTQSVSGRAAAQSRITLAPATAMSRMPARSMPKTTRRCVVEVELYRWTIARLDPAQGLERALDQRLAGLRQHLHGNVVRNHPLVDQLADEIEVGLRRGREADLDLLVPQADQQAEQPELPLGVHRLDQRLVAVAKVDAAPLRRTVDHPRRPLPVRQGDGGVGRVLAGRVDAHGRLSGHGRTARIRRPVLRRRSGSGSNWGRWFMCARGAAEAAAGRPKGRSARGARGGHRCECNSCRNYNRIFCTAARGPGGRGSVPGGQNPPPPSAALPGRARARAGEPISSRAAGAASAASATCTPTRRSRTARRRRIRRTAPARADRTAARGT